MGGETLRLAVVWPIHIRLTVYRDTILNGGLVGYPRHIGWTEKQLALDRVASVECSGTHVCGMHM